MGRRRASVALLLAMCCSVPAGSPGRGFGQPQIGTEAGLEGAPLAAAANGSGGQQSPRTRPSGYTPLTPAQQAWIEELLEGFRSDPRGPYLRIRWFCNDGTVLPPEPYACAERGGGTQHAELKPETLELAELGFHVGTIFTSIDFEEFRDEAHAGYRLRELPLTHFLEAVDDGWVLRRARYYRGASQAENEARNGRVLLERLLESREWRVANPFLASALAAAVPHGQRESMSFRSRGLAEQLGELDPEFQPLRVKIHSRPGADDLDSVVAYVDGLPDDTPDTQRAAARELEAVLRALYGGEALAERLVELADRLQPLPLSGRVRELASELERLDARATVSSVAALQRDARRALATEGALAPASEGLVALALLDLINEVVDRFNVSANAWIQEQSELLERGVDDRRDGGASSPTTPSRRELVAFVLDVLDAGYGSGMVYEREYRALRDAVLRALPSSITDPTGQQVANGAAISAISYHELVRYLSHAVDWAQASLHQTFGMVLERYLQVEPLSRGFIDDMLRGSPLLAYAGAIDLLSRDAGIAIGLLHSVFDREVYGGINGLNPGVAVGPLVILESLDEVRDLDPGGIYVLPETPADLERVAGILTLDEGSRLSHVQLLARSLGLPNAVISSSLLGALRPHAGATVFYAVSPMGTVVLKPAAEMTPDEMDVLRRRSDVSQTKIVIDQDRLDLSVREILPLEELELDDSGRIVGPKAANLARLHRLFPNRVAPGLTIPFGVFRQHIDRDLRGSGRTLYEDLVAIYEEADAAVAAGTEEAAVRRWVLAQLEEVRAAILDMELLPGFEAAIRQALRDRFGPDGTYGVFVRSDTNVEDLPTFTGAGLNLTVMNTIGTDEILDAIKRVWASPFTERSYTWRQRLLTTPESVYPSVVILQSVPVEASGVLATVDLSNSDPSYWTVTLSEGVGGVVEGEPAETMLVPVAGGPPVLLSSARAVWQKVLRMTGSGGIERVPVSGAPVLLTPPRLDSLREVIGHILERYPSVIDEDGKALPWDVEFGFLDDDVVLFQIRPLVSNRRDGLVRALGALDNAALESSSALIALDEAPLLERGGQ